MLSSQSEDSGLELLINTTIITTETKL